jgi:cell wall-associated NlpC family hydrolase
MELRGLVGRPYSPPFGCFALVREALAMRGVEVPDYAQSVTEDEKADALLRHLDEHACRVEAPAPGDVVLLTIGGRPAHIGVMLDGDEMLHSFEGAGACVERISSVRWRNRIAGFWRV